jgi:hypothetical protein
MAEFHDDRSTGEPSAEDILQHARAASQEIAALAGAVAGVGRKIANAVDFENRMREKPVQTLAVAFGAGYVAGGGFFTPVTGRFLKLATRLWLLPAIRRELTNQQGYH